MAAWRINYLIMNLSRLLFTRQNERPQHQVQVPTFFLGKYPVTQAQWQAIMGSLPQMDEGFQGKDLPVVNVWLELAWEFCARLSQQTSHNYRLPTEAEWEYACRAGTTTPFHWGLTLTTELANYNGSHIYKYEPAGEFRQKPTPLIISKWRMGLGFMICMVTFGNGVRIYGMMTIEVRQQMVVPG